MRNVIVHYHFFKNAGTSVDHVLERSFGERWYTHEGEQGRLEPDAVGSFIHEHSDLVALSSHTALFPLPELEGVQLYPIVFLRHPLDRVGSAYEFERNQGGITPGSRQAQSGSFAEYVNWRLTRPRDRAARNFQCLRFAKGIAPHNHPDMRREFEAACRFLDQLPFVGVVERFDASIQWLEAWLKPVFPGLQCEVVRRNATRGGRSLEERLATMRDELGDETYHALEQANAEDLALYYRAQSRLRDTLAELAADKPLGSGAAG